VTGGKIKLRDRWKHRPSRRDSLVTPIVSALEVPAFIPPALEVPAPIPPASPVGEALTPLDRARIDRWVASRIVTWAPDRCFHCKLPIIYGARWVELVNDNERARFHADCAPEWKLQQEITARAALGISAVNKSAVKERPTEQ
jgi:hypothetical protein